MGRGEREFQSHLPSEGCGDSHCAPLTRQTQPVPHMTISSTPAAPGITPQRGAFGEMRGRIPIPTVSYQMTRESNELDPALCTHKMSTHKVIYAYNQIVTIDSFSIFIDQLACDQIMNPLISGST